MVLFHPVNSTISLWLFQVEDTLKFEVCGQIGPVCVPFPTGMPDTVGKNWFD